MNPLRQAAQEFVSDYDCGGCGHFQYYAERFRTALMYPGTDYEQGFIDGMSEQARRSVDRFANAMTKTKEGKA
jgi:hypothetical protein